VNLLKTIFVLALVSSFAFATHSLSITSNTSGWLGLINQNYTVQFTISNSSYFTSNITSIAVNSPGSTLLLFNATTNDSSNWSCTNSTSVLTCTNRTPIAMNSSTILLLTFAATATADGNYIITTATTDNNSGTGSIANSLAFDTTPPSAASGLATTVLNDSGVNLVWTAGSDATSGIAYYMIFINSTNFVNGSNVANISATSYANYSLTYNNSYNFTLMSVDNAGFRSANVSLIKTIADVIAPINTFTQTPSGTTSVTVTYVLSATDLSGILGLSLSVDGTQVCQANSTACSGTVIYSTAGTTTHSYTALAYDKSRTNNFNTITDTFSVTVTAATTSSSSSSSSGSGGGGSGGGSTPPASSTVSGSGSCSGAVGVCLYINAPTANVSTTSPVSVNLSAHADTCDLTTDSDSSTKQTVDTISGAYSGTLSLANGDHTLSVTCKLTDSGLALSKKASVSFNIAGKVIAAPKLNTTTVTTPAVNATNSTKKAASAGSAGFLSGLVSNTSQPVAGIAAFLVVLAVGLFILKSNDLLPKDMDEFTSGLKDLIPKPPKHVTKPDYEAEGYRRPGLDRKVREEEQGWVDRDIRDEEKRIRDEEERLTELKRRLDELKRQRR